MTLKISRKNKKWRMKSSEGLFDCSDCRKGQHEGCEFAPKIFCRCWREQHRPTKKGKK